MDIREGEVVQAEGMENTFNKIRAKNLPHLGRVAHPGIGIL
jgi:hypothetical protein